MGAIQLPLVPVPSRQSIGFMSISFQPLDGKHNTESDRQKPKAPSVQFSSVAQLGLTLCDPMDCNMPGLPVLHQLPKPTQTHVHRVGETIQPPRPLSSPSPTFNLSQHQGLYK